jgi:hypothetical protein
MPWKFPPPCWGKKGGGVTVISGISPFVFHAERITLFIHSKKSKCPPRQEYPHDLNTVKRKTRRLSKRNSVHRLDISLPPHFPNHPHNMLSFSKMEERVSWRIGDPINKASVIFLE